MNKTIHCIGDSHASFFSGTNIMQPAWPARSNDSIPTLKSYRLGPVLAYNLTESNTTTQGREKLLEVLKSIPEQSYVLFCFGEIDIRVHLLKQALKQNRATEDVVKECAEKYFSVILSVKNKFKPVIWATVPSTVSEKTIDHRYPHFGTCIERNNATKIFNKTLKRLSETHGVIFVSIFETLVTENGQTNDYYYIDKVHLSQRAMPHAIATLKEKIPGLTFQLFNSRIIHFLPQHLQFTLLRIKSVTSTRYFLLQKQGRSIIKRIVFATVGERLWRKMT